MAQRTGNIVGVLGLLVGCGLVLSVGFPAVNAAAPASLAVSVGAVKRGGVIPGIFAFCIPAARGHVTSGPNRSPAIRWSKGPARTASYAIIMVDTDVPTVFDAANKEGQTIPADLKRRAFYHWVLVDIPPAVTGLREGADSTGITKGGKTPGPTKNGVRGVNDYGSFMKDGSYGGYDGPCPPWNDAIPHHYHFIVYALNVPSLRLSGTFTGPDALRAVEGHALARGEVVGVYTLNPDVAKRLRGK